MNTLLRLCNYLSHLNESKAFWSWLLVYFTNSIDGAALMQFDAIECIVYTFSSGS